MMRNAFVEPIKHKSSHRMTVAMSEGILLVPTLLFRSTRPRSLSSGNLSSAPLTLLTYLYCSFLSEWDIHHV